MMAVRVVVAIVHAHNESSVYIAGRGRYDDLAGTGIQMGCCCAALGENAGGFHHHIHAHVSPRQSRRVALGQHFQLLVSNMDG